ncbi:MopE-related protein, partial [Flavobacterium sp.]
NENQNVLITFYQDLDGDTFGNPNASTQACSQPEGYVLDNTDCNDNNPTLNQTLVFYRDADGDGFGDLDNYFASCTQPLGYVLDNSDCNDNQIQYADADNDGFGSTTQVACGVTNNTDCNDNNATQNVLITFYQDLDGDTFGNPNVSTQSCSQPVGYVLNNTDCNDNNASSTALISYYQDLDGDGFGNPLVVIQNCSQPIGYVASNTDCDDTRASVHPGAVDICYDGLDNDCNGIIDNNCTPIVSSVPTASCGSTISGLSTSVYATIVSGAQGYRFKITNTATGIVQIFDRPVNNLAFSAIPGVTYNTQYQVEIGVKYNNVWQPFYGAPCFVNTPSPTSTIGAQCGTTLTTMNQWINATYVSSISAYRFRITNTSTSEVQIVTTSLNKFNMTQLANRSYNTTYFVEVALRNTDGTFLPYGQGCNITTPFFPTTKLRDDKCGYVVYNSNELLPANVVSGATAYRFKIYNTALGYETILNRATSSFSISLLSGLVSETSYKVQVSVQINNEFGPYGEDCNISLPGLVDRASEINTVKTLNASIVPNPFSSVFNIKLENNSTDNITINVYDLTGRMLENKTIQSSEIQSFSFGENYPSGVYNLILSQGDQVKSLRIIKR